ncbi:Abi family protein [Bacillus aquiflavi]|uniref:Abi family protein n=1 Tax=Bacillus aquiflavi TaxID=2672567 RepID=A0A6B3VSB7_9BACI|nr:Abi family protein [Bacillus aquiflavi]MBA4536492.1 Abi family protein [Bacillus aquiflavi]NEY80859.1 Abi family protein [Bacillus aquiflavi]
MVVVDTFLKKKLTFNEMIDHLENKGVQFNIINKKEAKTILKHSNYFFKLTAFRKNFDKDELGKYINLDFFFLSNLASVDMQLRYVVLQMSLDIEHAIKTKILTDVTNNPKEDGYTLVKDFFTFESSTIDRFMKPLKPKTHYNHGIYKKYNENTPVWILFEIITFGGFVKFVEFYYTRFNKPKEYKDLYEVLKHVKNIRNSAAHNSPLLMDIVKINQLKVDYVRPITDFIKQIPGISKSVRRKKLSNRKIHDLTALFLVYDNFIINIEKKRARYRELNDMLKNLSHYKKYYKKHEGFISVYNYFFKIIDFLYEKA